LSHQRVEPPRVVQMDACAGAFLYQLPRGEDTKRGAAAAGGDSPQMIFQHYRELVRPAAAKARFSITPGKAGKVVAMPKGA
jgi:hypothetical protein